MSKRQFLNWTRGAFGHPFFVYTNGINARDAMNQEIKGNLARLLATENLIVEHRKVATASFDVDRRVLTLPNWDRASSVVYDMLVGHEVGHALFTPNEDWRDAVDCPKDFINVIEDARIEKLMKRKYPGLRKSFSGGYKELNDHDFFGIAGEDLSKLSLIDRINLHFKCGADALIPFSIEEKVFVARTDVAETFAEVCEIAADVFKFSKQEKEQEQVAEAMPPQQSTQDGGGSTQDGGEQEENANDNANEEDNANEDAPVGNQPSQQKEGGDTFDDELGEEGSETQSNFDKAAEKLTNKWANNPVYVEIPESVDLPTYIADWTEIHDWIDEQRNAFLKDKEDSEEYYESVDSSYREFRKSSQKEVNYLVKEFECKKSADAYARSATSRTGVLDTGKLHTYKYNEDLFKKVNVIPDGKNHGMIFVLDWSGSMGHEILATVKQLLNLTTFCKKVQIPFEVYAFTNDYYAVRRIKDGQDVYVSNEEYYANQNCEEGKVFIGKNMFHMMNFVSSRSNSKEYERMCLNLYREAYTYTYHTYYHATTGIGLSGTPLNESIVLLNYILPQFKKQNDIQKVNVCILTDGEACMSAYGRKFYNEYEDKTYIRPRRMEYGCVLRDRKTGNVYSATDGWAELTNNFINQVRDRNPGVNVIGFRIMSGGNLSGFVSNYGSLAHYDQVQKQWKKDKSAIIPFPKGYTALYALSNTTIQQDDNFDVETGAKKGEISKAFKKMLKGKSANKKLLSSFIEYVA